MSFKRFETLNQLKFYISSLFKGKKYKRDGGHVLGAQVLRGVGSDKGLCPLYFRVG